eukprot:3016790-Rhodomonas_salina.2
MSHKGKQMRNEGRTSIMRWYTHLTTSGRVSASTCSQRTPTTISDRKPARAGLRGHVARLSGRVAGVSGHVAGQLVTPQALMVTSQTILVTSQARMVSSQTILVTSQARMVTSQTILVTPQALMVTSHDPLAAASTHVVVSKQVLRVLCELSTAPVVALWTHSPSQKVASQHNPSHSLSSQHNPSQSLASQHILAQYPAFHTLAQNRASQHTLFQVPCRVYAVTVQGTRYLRTAHVLIQHARSVPGMTQAATCKGRLLAHVPLHHSAEPPW